MKRREDNENISTNDSPNKSKTKCIAFLRKKRPLVEYARHLGNIIVSIIHGTSQDIIAKESAIHYSIVIRRNSLAN